MYSGKYNLVLGEGVLNIVRDLGMQISLMSSYAYLLTIVYGLWLPLLCCKK